MILPNDTFERLYSFKWTIEKEVILNLRVTIPVNNHSEMYYLIPIKEIPVFSLLEEFEDTNSLLIQFEKNYEPLKEFENNENLLLFSETILMSILTFASRNIFYLTEVSEIKKLLKEFLELPNFEDRKNIIMEFSEDVIIKKLCEICEETEFYAIEFQDEELSYANDSGLYDMYIDSINRIQENIYFQILIQNDINALDNLIENTFKSAILYLSDIDITSYETLIGKRISIDEMKETIYRIRSNFFTKNELTQKVFGQLKTKKHPLSFLFEDSFVKSKYDNNYVLKSLTIGLINSAVSVSIINAIDKRDRENYVTQVDTLKLFNVDEGKMFLAEHLIRLCDSKKYIQYVPILSISIAYNALSEKKVLSLSKLLLQSVNPNTLKNHYSSLSHIDIWEQIKFNN